MSRPAERRAPLWFVALVSVLGALLLRYMCGLVAGSAADGSAPSSPTFAFWVFIGVLAEAIWKGIEVAGKVALAILQYSVQLLWRVVVLLGKGAQELAGYAWTALRKGWQLLELTYTHVIKPAWKFIWKWVDKTQHWLERTFAPLMKWLRRIRTWVLDFYTTYVRPLLDIIDIGRRVLGVLGSLGIEWARRLDARLAQIEEMIDRPFRLALAKINEIINIVNRVVTADGLFQRLAMLRSIERDMQYVQNQLTNAYHRPATLEEKERATSPMKELTLEQHVAEAKAVARRRSTEYSGRIEEEVADVKRMLRELRT